MNPNLNAEHRERLEHLIVELEKLPDEKYNHAHFSDLENDTYCALGYATEIGTTIFPGFPLEFLPAPDKDNEWWVEPQRQLVVCEEWVDVLGSRYRVAAAADAYFGEYAWPNIFSLHARAESSGDQDYPSKRDTINNIRRFMEGATA